MKLGGYLTTFLAIAGGTFLLLKGRTERTAIRAGLDDAVVGINPSTRAATLEEPFATRIIGPAARRVAGVVYRFGPKGLREQTRHRLVLAGLQDRLDVDTFYAFSVATPLVVGATVLLYRKFIGPVPFIGWLVIPASAFFPKMWLTSKVEKRQGAIRRALPDTLDLLTIAVEAGLGFDAALGRVVNSVPGPLSDELYRMLQELRIGVTREQALRSLSERTKVPDLD